MYAPNTQKTFQIPSENESFAAEMRMLSAMERSETQKTLKIRSDNANVECYGKLQNTENITDLQR